MTLVGVWKLVEKNRTWTMQVSFSYGTAQTAPCGCSGNGKGPWMPRLGTCVLGSHGFFCATLYKESQQAISGPREKKRDSPLDVKSKYGGQGKGIPLLYSVYHSSPLPAILLVLVCIYCYMKYSRHYNK